MSQKQRKKHQKEQKKQGLNILFYIFAGFVILFIPVFHINSVMDITLMPRTLVMSIFLLMLSVILLGKKYYQRIDFNILRLPLIPVTFLYLITILISLFFAVNVREGYFDIVRTSIFLYVLIIAAILFVHTEGWKEKLPQLMIFSGLLAVIIGGVQYYDKVLMATSDVLDDRRALEYAVTGVMSHKNEYSNALMLLLPFLAYGIYRFRKGWKVLSIITFVLIMIMIILIKTRSVWVGIAIATVFISIMMVIFAKKIKLPDVYRFIILGGLALMTGSIIYIYTFVDAEDDFSFLGRVRNIANTQSSHNVHRINVWKSSLKMIEEHPVTGVGAGNWQIMIAPYTAGKFGSISALNWGRPHNDFIWVWAEKGPAGILLYLAMFLISFWYLISVFLRSPHIPDKVLALLISGGIISYMAISFFSFPYERINHTIFLAMMMAAALALYRNMQPGKPFKPKLAIPVILTVVLFGFGILYGYHSVDMETHMKKTIAAENRGNYEEAISYAQKSMNSFRSLNPMAYPPEYYVAKSDYQIGKQLMGAGQQDAGIQRMQMALRGFEHTLELFPGNIWTISRMGLVYNDLGNYYKEKQDTLKANEQFRKTAECLTYMLHLVPTLKQERMALAGTYYQVGDYQKALDEFKKVKNYKKNKAVKNNIKILEGLLEKQQGEAAQQE